MDLDRTWLIFCEQDCMKDNLFDYFYFDFSIDGVKILHCQMKLIEIVSLETKLFFKSS